MGGPIVEVGGLGVVIHLPLWMLFLLTAIPTAYLFWHDRYRVPPACCRKCGYNLTGNVSGICPECGTTIPDEQLTVCADEDVTPPGDSIPIPTNAEDTRPKA